MRKLGISLLVCSMAVVPFAAMSQETADDYVCALTGECAEEAAPGAAAPAADDDGPRVSATRGFSLSRPAPANRPAPKATAPTNRQRQASRPTQRQTRPAQPGRVDLRLGFGLGSATLSANDQARARTFAEALKLPQLATVKVRIEGHTDSSGGRAVNMSLSQRRAQAVADYLVSQGVPAARLEVRGFGYDRPLPGRNAASSANRRVEAVKIG